MRKILGYALLSVTVCGANGGCAKSDEAVADELVRLMEEMASIADEQRADCDAMGDQLNALVSSKKKLIEAGKQIKRDPARAKVFGEKYRDRVRGAGKKMLRGLLKCGSHDKVREAIKPTLMK